MSKQLYKDLGLPTFPINNGMTVGDREEEEIHWLLDHGVLQSDLYSYLKIAKISAREYHLTRCKDSRYSEQEEMVLDAPDWQTLVEMEHLDLAYWNWYFKREDS